MSSMHLSKVRAEALELPESDRAALAKDLLSSLDGAPDPDADLAWDEEILRRLHEVESGKAVTFSAEEVFHRIEQRLAARKPGDK